MSDNENEIKGNSTGEVDIYFQPIDNEDSDELRNLAENPRALTEDFNEDSLKDIEAVTAGQDEFDTSNASEYSEDDIQVLEGLEAVRKRPGMYIGDTTLRGLHHLVYEIVANSVDEALAGRCDTIDVRLNKDGSVTYPVTVKIKNNIDKTSVQKGSGNPYLTSKYGPDMRSVVYFFAPAGGKITSFKNNSNLKFVSGTYQDLKLYYNKDLFWIKAGKTVTFTFKVTTAPGVNVKPKVVTTPLLSAYRNAKAPK